MVGIFEFTPLVFIVGTVVLIMAWARYRRYRQEQDGIVGDSNSIDGRRGEGEDGGGGGYEDGEDGDGRRVYGGGYSNNITIPIANSSAQVTYGSPVEGIVYGSGGTGGYGMYPPPPPPPHSSAYPMSPMQGDGTYHHQPSFQEYRGAYEGSGGYATIHPANNNGPTMPIPPNNWIPPTPFYYQQQQHQPPLHHGDVCGGV